MEERSNVPQSFTEPRTLLRSQGLKGEIILSDIISPLQGYYFPRISDKPSVNDYNLLFDVAARSAPVDQRVRLTWPLSWSVDVAPDTAHGALVVYRVNRLNELLHAVMPHHETTMPNLRYKLQMYIDAHIPAAAALQGDVVCAPDVQRMMLPDVPMASTMMRFSGEVARALMYTPKQQTMKRNAKRAKPLWEIIRWTLPRQLQVGCSPNDKKVRSFKTLSSDFSEFFALDSSLHDIVACCMLGNYPSSSSRPNWASRLTIYKNYVQGKTTVSQGWLKRCDYITFYAIRELVVEILPHNIGIMNMIKSCPQMNEAWNQYVMDTKSIANRMRSGINDFLSDTLLDIHDSVKNRHNRCVKSGFADGALSEAKETNGSEAPAAAWSGRLSARMANGLLLGGARVTASKAPSIEKSMHEELAKNGYAVPAAVIKADVSRAVYISSNIHTFVLPADYTRQLVDSLSRGQDRQLTNGSAHKDTPCSSTEDAVRRCTMYACTQCHKLMNHVIDDATNARETRLKFRHVVRIDIDDGQILRYCDACLEKGSASRMELLEVPLLRRGEAPGEWSCSAISVFDRVVNVCARCTLLVERQNLRRCARSGEWCCVFCRI